MGAGPSSIVLKANHAVSNGGDGFQINNSTRTQVIDMNPNCWRPVNTWTGNTFVAKSPDCIR